MEGIREWAFSVCAAMIACGVAGMLLPKGSLQKIYSVTLSVFFICALLSPVITGGALPDIEVTDYSQEEITRRVNALEEIMAAQTDSAVKRRLEKIVAEKLDEMGIKVMDITINISTEGQNGPVAESVDIILAKEHEARHDAILWELRDSLGLKVYLGYADESPREKG